MTVVFIQKLLKLFLGHGFYVKWAGTKERGYVSSREAAEFCPQVLIKFYQSRLTMNDKDEAAVKLRVKALDFKVKLKYVNFTKFRIDLNFTNFRTDLNITRFRTDKNFTKFRTDLNFNKFRTNLNFTKFRTDLKFTKSRSDTETIEQ